MKKIILAIISILVLACGGIALAGTGIEAARAEAELQASATTYRIQFVWLSTAKIKTYEWHNYEAGKTFSYPAIPGTVGEYEFIGWDTEPQAVNKDMMVCAKYNAPERDLIISDNVIGELQNYSVKYQSIREALKFYGYPLTAANLDKDYYSGYHYITKSETMSGYNGFELIDIDRNLEWGMIVKTLHNHDAGGEIVVFEIPENLVSSNYYFSYVYTSPYYCNLTNNIFEYKTAYRLFMKYNQVYGYYYEFDIKAHLKAYKVNMPTSFTIDTDMEWFQDKTTKVIRFKLSSPADKTVHFTLNYDGKTINIGWKGVGEFFTNAFSGIGDFFKNPLSILPGWLIYILIAIIALAAVWLIATLVSKIVKLFKKNKRR